MFKQLQSAVLQRFKQLSDTGVLFRVDVDRDKVWQTYLNAIPEDLRQSNTCNCCKSFFRQYGGIVGIGSKNEMLTLWDFDHESIEYGAAIKAVQEYIRSLPIAGLFFGDAIRCGTEKSPDPKNGVVWSHFYVDLPKKFVNKNPGPVQGDALANKDVMKRSMEEITDDAVDTTLEIIAQGSLYRGNEFEGMLKEFRTLKTRYKKVKAGNRDNWCWAESSKVSPAIARIRNTAIGTLLNNLSEGMDLESAVCAFERVVAPTNYKRPTALVTPRMVSDAQKRLEELGLISALNRRLLSEQDLNVNNTLFVHRAIKSGVAGVFEQMKQDITVNPKSISKVEEVTIDDFIQKVVPTAKSIRLLLENKHLNNLASLVGPVDPEEPTLFRWGNNFSWSYSGEVADSIKERVKTAGGKVDGVLRVSLSWHNHDDLDLHLHEPSGYKVYFGNKGRMSDSGAVLDVDMNFSSLTRTPVENITWAAAPRREGRFVVEVNNYSCRESSNTGFTVEIEYDGEIHTYDIARNGSTGHRETVVEFEYTKKGGIKLFRNGTSTSASNYPVKEKWGVKTGQFHQVRAITNSPNHWSDKQGNKHTFFFLEGCTSDEKTRGFYNEFLKEDLLKDRKVFEVLGSKVTVETAEKELSGVGFSETLRNDFIVEVEGKFKRMIKVKV